ncbi:MAG: MAPEG family protein [Pseudomonadota bacterium]
MIVTPLYAGLLALWFLALSARVIQGRSGPQAISLGDGGKPEFLRHIRGHANFAEYVPLILGLLLMLELGGTPHWLLHALGGTLLVARLLHGYALSFTEKFMFGRFFGTLLTFVVMGVAALLCIWQAVKAA